MRTGNPHKPILVGRPWALQKQNPSSHVENERLEVGANVSQNLLNSLPIRYQNLKQKPMGQDETTTLDASFSMAIRAILKSRSDAIPPRLVVYAKYRFVGVSCSHNLRL